MLDDIDMFLGLHFGYGLNGSIWQLVAQWVQVSVACSTDMTLFGYDQGVFGM